MVVIMFGSKIAEVTYDIFRAINSTVWRSAERA